MAESTQVTAADIARIARVSRTTVSNWRRRYEDFPAPVGGSGNRALFDRAGVEEWLSESGRLPEREPHERVWERVREINGGGEELGEAVAMVHELLLHLSRGDIPAVGTVEERLVARSGGVELVGAVREVAQTPERARGLSDHLHAAYLESLGGKAHITPEPLARLMVGLVGVRGAEVFDPACGTGALLRSASRDGAVGLYGQEADEPTARLAQALVGLVPSGAPGRIVGGDSLTADAFGDRLFDAVLCNPPFNQRDWGAEQLAYDERWVFGVPPRAESELAWIQHCLAHTRPCGRAVVLMPPAAASRPSGRRIRRELLRRGALSAVIALPVGAAAPVHVGLHLWVLHQPDPAESAASRVLFVDTTAGNGDDEGESTGSRDGDGGERRPVEWERLLRSVTRAWHGFLDAPDQVEHEPGFSQTVPVIELMDDSVDLTPQRHLPVAAPEVNGREARRGVGDTRRRLLRALEDTRSSAPGRGWAAREAREWRKTTVADLARSGALVLHRASSSGVGPTAEENTGTGPRVLTLSDVLGGGDPSGRFVAEPEQDEQTREPVKIRAGDVVVPSALARRGLSRSRVISGTDAGSVLGANLHLISPDPAHIDPWFLAGFLEDQDNLRRAGLGSTIVRVDLRRLSVPLLPLEEQRRYGAAFRELHEFRVHLDRAREAAGELEERLTGALRAGLLTPPSPAISRAGEEVTDLP